MSSTRSICVFAFTLSACGGPPFVLDDSLAPDASSPAPTRAQEASPQATEPAYEIPDVPDAAGGGVDSGSDAEGDANRLDRAAPHEAATAEVSAEIEAESSSTEADATPDVATPPTTCSPVLPFTQGTCAMHALTVP